MAARKRYSIYRCDCLAWLRGRRANSIHAVVTDPPYGLLEYSQQELGKRKDGNGIWRLPNCRDGASRNPSPRFTVLSQQDLVRLRAFVLQVGAELHRALVPGGHIVWATHPLLSHIVSGAFAEAGFEKRGEIIRVLKTLRGGERPKGAHDEFPEVCVLPKGCWEPWVLFRKRLCGTVRENLRRYGTGALRRISVEEPLRDLIPSSRATSEERRIAPHPSLKPQSFMRKVVHASLPLGRGIVLDPFMGSGSTIAAACHLGLRSIGVEVSKEYFQLARRAIPRLAEFIPNGENGTAI